MIDKGGVEEHQAVIVQNESINPNHIKIIEGSTDILLIAPHACIRKGEPKDDENTGPITEMVARQTGCSSIINTYFHKPGDKGYPHGLEDGNLNMNLIADAQLIPDYLNAIRAVIDTPGKTTVIWIHGADDEKVKKVSSKVKYPYQPNQIHAFIGYGQGDDPITKTVGSRYTAELTTVNRFRDALIRNEMNAVVADDEAANYRGRNEERMNQWFMNQGYTHEQVESIQLEIRYKGFREDAEQCQNTARIITDAISATLEIKPIVMEEAVLETQLVEQTTSNRIATENTVPKEVPVLVQVIKPEIVQNDEDPLVADAFEYLKNSFRQHFHEAMLEAGRYLVDKFYDKDYDWARKGKKPKKKRSLNKLIERLQANSGCAPSKTWIYDAVRLAVDDHFYNVEGGRFFRAYGKLGHSQKLRIAYVNKPEIKEKFIAEIADQEEPFTDKVLRERIAESKLRKPKKKRVPSIFEKINNSDKSVIEHFTIYTRFDDINRLGDYEINKILNSSNKIMDQVKTEIEKLENEIKVNQTELSIYKDWNNQFCKVKEWHETLKKRKSGYETVEYPKETARLKKLREAVHFMCFWKRYNYSDFVLKYRATYIPLEEANEFVLECLLRNGKCDLKPTYNFDVTKEGKVKWLSYKQVEKRLEKGTFWMSREKYDLLTNEKYYNSKYIQLQID